MADNESPSPGSPSAFEPPSAYEPAVTNHGPTPSQPYSPPPPTAAPAPQPPSNQPPAPAPGHWPPPPPAKKKSHKSLWITLGTIFAVLALAIGACSVWFVSTVKAPVDEANRFLAAVDAGDYPAAVAMMGGSCEGATVTVAMFDEIFAGRAIDYDLKSSSITNDSATVGGSIKLTGVQDTASNIELFLRNRDGWQVCGFRVSASSDR